MDTALTLKIMKHYTARRSAMPILDGTVQVNGKVSATDMEVSASMPLPDDWSGEPGIYNIKDTESLLKLQQQPRATGLDLDDFPRIATWPPPVDDISLDAETFTGMLERVLPAASKDETRPILCGVLLEIKGDTLKLVATDSYRLHVAEHTGGLVYPTTSVIIPADTFRAILKTWKAFPKKQRPKDIGFYYSETGDHADHVFFSVGPVEIASRVVIGQFPDYQRLLPDADDCPVKLTAIDPAVGRSKYREDSVVLSIGTNATISVPLSSGPYAERVSAPFPATVSNPSDTLEIGFNPGFLYDLVKAAGADATLHLVSALRPGLITSPGFTGLLMPVRLTS